MKCHQIWQVDEKRAQQVVRKGQRSWPTGMGNEVNMFLSTR